MIHKIKNKLLGMVYNTLNPLGKAVRNKNLTYLSSAALYNISKYVKYVDRNKIPGILVETGCALGGSTIVIGAKKSKDRNFKVFDVFGMIPPPSENDDDDVIQRYQTIKTGNSAGIGKDIYYGYEENLLDKVKQNMKEFGLSQQDNIELIQGLYEETLYINDPVALAHIDCDWYSSVMTCLENIEPKIVEGGIMIIDDYYDWSGCRKAIDKYFSKEEIRSRYTFSKENGKLILKKNI